METLKQKQKILSQLTDLQIKINEKKFNFKTKLYVYSTFWIVIMFAIFAFYWLDFSWMWETINFVYFSSKLLISLFIVYLWFTWLRFWFDMGPILSFVKKIPDFIEHVKEWQESYLNEIEKLLEKLDYYFNSFEFVNLKFMEELSKENLWLNTSDLLTLLTKRENDEYFWGTSYLSFNHWFYLNKNYYRKDFLWIEKPNFLNDIILNQLIYLTSSDIWQYIQSNKKDKKLNTVIKEIQNLMMKKNEYQKNPQLKRFIYEIDKQLQVKLEFLKTYSKLDYDVFMNKNIEFKNLLTDIELLDKEQKKIEILNSNFIKS